MPPLKSSAAPDGDGDEASGQTEDVARPTHQPGSIKRIKSIGQDLGSSRITGLDPTAGFSGWHALKFDVVVALACCAVMKVVPRVSKLPSSYESVLRRILYLSLGLRVALPAVYDVVRYQWRLITGKWQDDKTLHGCGLSVIGTGKWFRIMMISDILMRATMVNASLAPDLLAHHIVYYCFAWFGVHMSSKGEEWRDCIISGGWQVLACEAMGAANGLVLLLRPADISRWMRITTVATILGIRTPVHASMMFVSSRYRRAVRAQRSEPVVPFCVFLVASTDRRRDAELAMANLQLGSGVFRFIHGLKVAQICISLDKRPSWG